MVIETRRNDAYKNSSGRRGVKLLAVRARAGVLQEFGKEEQRMIGLVAASLSQIIHSRIDRPGRSDLPKWKSYPVPRASGKCLAKLPQESLFASHGQYSATSSAGWPEGRCSPGSPSPPFSPTTPQDLFAGPISTSACNLAFLATTQSRARTTLMSLDVT
ncbi:hypothetical protein VTK56DRAFT_364 [Thermocarpiscus australiensis]